MHDIPQQNPEIWRLLTSAGDHGEMFWDEYASWKIISFPTCLKSLIFTWRNWISIGLTRFALCYKNLSICCSRSKHGLVEQKTPQNGTTFTSHLGLICTIIHWQAPGLKSCISLSSSKKQCRKLNNTTYNALNASLLSHWSIS